MFYLPESWLKKGRNTLTFVLRPADKFGNSPVINSVSIIAYNQYVTKNNDLKVAF